MPKIITNTTGGNISIVHTGILIQAGETITIDPENYSLWASGVDKTPASQIDTLITAGSLVVNDGHENLNVYEAIKFLKHPDEAWNVRFWTDDRRANGFPNDKDTVQEAIEYAKSGAFDNDLDKFQYARQGSTSNNTYLLTLNNIVSYDSPDTLKYNIIFRGFSVSVSALAAPFTLELWKADSNHSVRTMIYSETFSIANGNFTGYSGYTTTDLAVSVDKGWGLYVKAINVGNPKPSDLNVLVWTRQR